MYGHIGGPVGDARTLVVKTQGGTPVRNRQRLPVRVVPEVCHLFDGAGVAVRRPAGAGDGTTSETELDEAVWSNREAAGEKQR